MQILAALRTHTLLLIRIYFQIHGKPMQKRRVQNKSEKLMSVMHTYMSREMKKCRRS